jgi:hypothetical protein
MLESRYFDALRIEQMGNELRHPMYANIRIDFFREIALVVEKFARVPENP